MGEKEVKSAEKSNKQENVADNDYADIHCDSQHIFLSIVHYYLANVGPALERVGVKKIDQRHNFLHIHPFNLFR